MLSCTGQLITAALFAIFSTDNIRDTSPLLCHRSPSGRHGHIRAPRTWLHHIYVYKKIHTWCRETPGNPSSATAPAGGRHEEGSCTPSPRELQCQHHTPCPGSLTHTKTPQTWCCLYSSHSVTRRGRKVRDRGSRPNLQEMGPSSHPEGKRFGVQRLLVTSSQGLGKQPVLFGRTKSP